MLGLGELNKTLKSFRDEVRVLNGHLVDLKKMVAPMAEAAEEVDDLKNKVIRKIKEALDV